MSDIRDRFFAATRRRIATVQVPTIGDVLLRSLTSDEMRAFKDSLTDERGKLTKRGDNFERLLVAQCVCDESGNRVFADEDALSGGFGGVDGAVIAALYGACVRHTNWRSDPDWTAIEGAAKN